MSDQTRSPSGSPSAPSRGTSTRLCPACAGRRDRAFWRSGLRQGWRHEASAGQSPPYRASESRPAASERFWVGGLGLDVLSPADDSAEGGHALPTRICWFRTSMARSMTTFRPPDRCGRHPGHCPQQHSLATSLSAISARAIDRNGAGGFSPVIRSGVAGEELVVAPPPAQRENRGERLAAPPGADCPLRVVESHRRPFPYRWQGKQHHQPGGDGPGLPAGLILLARADHAIGLRRELLWAARRASRGP